MKFTPNFIGQAFNWINISLGKNLNTGKAVSSKLKEKNTGGKTVIASPNSVIFFAL
jgi:hypothetical protein